eukprot:2211825-Amphidinium_carterae.1
MNVPACNSVQTGIHHTQCEYVFVVIQMQRGDQSEPIEAPQRKRAQRNFLETRNSQSIKQRVNGIMHLGQ